jgi:hypothetical protein
MGMVEYIVLGEHREGDRRFNDIDLAFFKSEAGLAKVKRSFENSPYDFRFIVALGAPHIGAGGNMGTVKLSDMPVFVRKQIGGDLKIPGVITVVYTNNATNPDMHFPLHAWTLIHRIAHMVQLESNQQDLERQALLPIVDSLSKLGKLDITYSGSIGTNDNHPLYASARLLMTMRSARLGQIHTALDVFAELLAQFVITGQITLNRYEGWRARHDLAHELAQQVLENIPINDRSWAAVNDGAYTHRRDINSTLEKLVTSVGSYYSLAEINAEIAVMEANLNAAMKGVVDQMVGDSFIW